MILISVIFLFTASKACHFKHLVGGCSGSYLRYYYDSIHNKCKKFLWTGCFGNGNRFFSMESCNATCAGIHGKHIFILYTQYW